VKLNDNMSQAVFPKCCDVDIFTYTTCCTMECSDNNYTSRCRNSIQFRILCL